VIRVTYDGKKYFVGFSVKWEEQHIQQAICEQVRLPQDSMIRLLVEEKEVQVAYLKQEENCKYLHKYQLIVDKKGVQRETTGQTQSALQFLAEKLQMHFYFQCALDETFGNAILTKTPLDPVRKQQLMVSGQETRSVVGGCMKIAEKSLHLYCTHLDDRLESTRVKQIQDLHSVVPSTPHIILGDFNALRKDDYTDEQWKKISVQRENAAKEKPVTELMELIESNYKYNCWGENKSTCKYGTRIDYIFGSEACSKILQVTKSQVLETDASDHSIVIVDVIML